MIRSSILFTIVVIFFAGCSSTSEVQKIEPKVNKEQQLKDKQAALQLFIDGSLKESKAQFADAVLDYQEALRFDQDPAIYYALAKCYSQLHRHALATESGLEALKRDPENIDYRQTLAGIYINAGQFDEAAKEFSELVRRDSNNVNALYALAQLSERTRPMEALKLYEHIMERNGPTWEVLLQIAQLNTILQRFPDAAKAFEQMVKIDPANTALKQNLVDTYVRARQPEKAQELLNDLLEKKPADANMNAAMAELYLQKGDWKNAEKHLSTVLKKDSLEADVRFRIGIAYFTQSQKDSTLLPKTYDLFKKFSIQYPNDWRALLYCGVIARMAKEDSSAQIYFTKATQVANWNPDAWWQLGWLFFDKQNFDEAITVMEKAKQYLPDEFRVHLLLGIVYSRAQRNQEARVALERAVELNPTDLNALSSLGLTYDALKMHAESDSSYERALRIDPNYPLVLNNYAYSLSERGIQLDRAMKMSKASLAKDSLNSSYLDTYGWILFQNAKYDEALVYIKKAVDLGEVSAVVLEHLGDVYAKLQKFDDAKKYWKKALELDKKNTALQTKLERGQL